MTRKKKLLLNTLTALVHQIITLVCGFILPRLIITHFGSETNGLVSSISQFLAFCSMMDMGVGAVVRASLYKPLADQDDRQMSLVLISARRFFRKVGAILIAYVAVLMVLFPFLVDTPMSGLTTSILVGAMALGTIAQFLFGVVYTQLLMADQRAYVQLIITTIITVLNTVIGVILIQADASIVVVKFAAAIVMLMRPFALKVYCDRRYKIDFTLKLEGEPIKQKWNGLTQHIATYILKYVDTVVLTIFSTLKNVSIYNVYHLVTNGLQQMIEVMTSGMAPLLGDMYARNESEKLERTFSCFEWVTHTLVTLIYCIAGIMILPFVDLYTKNVVDANYHVPVFALLIVLANSFYCLRISYSVMVKAAGHFKETQWSAIIEAGLNVVVSIALVIRFGLVGVAIGTLVAMTYRTVYFAWYLKDHILHRSLKHFVAHVAVDFVTVVLAVTLARLIPNAPKNWLGWGVQAIEAGVITAAVSGVVNFVFYRPLIKDGIAMIFKRGGKK